MNLVEIALNQRDDVIMFVISSDYKYMAFNSLHAKIVEQNYNVKIYEGLDFSKFWGEDNDLIKQNIDLALEGNSITRTEAVKINNNLLKPFETSYSSVRSESGNIIGVSVLGKEIKDDNSWNPLNKQEDFFKGLVKNAAEGILVLEKKSKEIVFVNPSFCESFEYTPSELYHLRIENIYHEDDREEVLCSIEDSIEFQKTTSKDRKCLTKSGTIKYFSVSTSYLILDQNEFLVGFYTDITKTIENKQLADEFNELVEVSEDLIAITDFEGKFLMTNPQWPKLLGYSKSELLGRKVLDFVHPEDYERTEKEALALYSSKPTTSKFENRYLTKEGKTVWLEWNSRSDFEKKRNYSVAREITDFKIREDLQQKITNSLYKLSSQQLNDTESFEEFICIILGDIHEILEVKRVSYWTFSESENNEDYVECRYLTENSVEITQPKSRLYKKDFPSYFKALESKRTIAAGDAANHPSTREFTENYLRDYDIKSLLDVHVNVSDRKEAILCIESGVIRKWTFDEQSYAISLAEIIGSFISTLQRKKALEALKESEEQFKAFTNFLPGKAYIKNVSGVHLYANQKMLDYLGTTLDHYVGTTAYDFFDKEYADLLTRQDKKCIESKTLLSKEFHDIKSSDKWYEEYKFPILNEGKVVRIGGILLDISDRKKAELNQHRATRQLSLAIETAKLGIWEFDYRNNELIWNSEMYQIYEMEDFDNTISKWRSAVHDEDGEKVDRKFQAIDQGGSADTFQYRIVTPTGKTKHILASGTAIDNEEGKIKTMMGINIDVTEIKEKEVKIKLQKSMQEILIKISMTYINMPLDQQSKAIQISLQEMGEFVQADRAYVFDYDFENKTCTNTFEYTGSGIEPQIDHLQEAPIDLAPDVYKAHLKGEIYKIDDVSKINIDIERQFFKEQGIKSIINVPMIDGQDCVGFVGFDSVGKTRTYSMQEIKLLKVYAELLVNIKKRARSQKELDQLLSNTISQNQRLKDFSFITSHNIRSSVSNLIGISHLMEDEPQNPHSLDLLKETTHNLDLSIRNLGELLHKEQESLSWSKVNVNDIINRTLSQFSNYIDEHNIKIDESIDPNISLKTIPLYFESIVHNVIINALKHGTSKANNKIEIKAKRVSGNLNIVVKDYGKGIDLEKYKSKMYKLGSRFHEESTGQGMGLFLVKNHLDYIGGEIDIHSQPGQGARIELYFYE